MSKGADELFEEETTTDNQRSSFEIRIEGRKNDGIEVIDCHNNATKWDSQKGEFVKVQTLPATNDGDNKDSHLLGNLNETRSATLFDNTNLRKSYIREYDNHNPGKKNRVGVEGEGGSDTRKMSFWRTMKELDRGLVLKIVTISLVMFSIGLGLSLLLYFIAREAEEERVERELFVYSGLLISNTVRGLYTIINSLTPLATFIQLRPDLTPDDFRHFADITLINSDNALLGVSWVPQVLHSQRAAYEAQALIDRPTEAVGGFKGFLTNGTVVRPSPVQERYFSVFYIEPFVDNKPAYLLDVYSNKARNEAITEAINTNKTVSTAKITVVQEQDRNSFGTLLIVPVFNRTKGNNLPVNERLNATLGLMNAVQKLDRALVRSLSGTSVERVNVFLLDVTNGLSDKMPVLVRSSPDGQSWVRKDPEEFMKTNSTGIAQHCNKGIVDTLHKSGDGWYSRVFVYGGRIYCAVVEGERGFYSQREDYTNENLLFLCNVLAVFAITMGLFFILFQMAAMQTAQYNQMLEIERRHAAEHSNDLKQSFLNYIFHEVRVPFNALYIGLQWLQSEFLPAMWTVKNHFQNKKDSSASGSGPAGPTALGKLIDLHEELVASVCASNDCSEQILHILNDVLDMSKIENEQLSLASSFFKFKTALDVCMKNFYPFSEKKNIIMSSNIHPALHSLEVYGDKFRLIQCVSNLISNAIKFTGTGGEVTLLASISEQEERKLSHVVGTSMQNIDENLEVRVSVKDTGRGISEENMAKLFRPYVQIQSHTQDETEIGTGLGLCICKAIIEAHSGKVEVISDGVSGTEFSFVIPFPFRKAPISRSASVGSISSGLSRINSTTSNSNKANRNSTLGVRNSDIAKVSVDEMCEMQIAGELDLRLEESDEITSVEDLKNFRFLLAEDNAATRNMMKLLFGSLGWKNLDFAENGQIAYEMATSEEQKYDLIFMDNNMPVMNGMEATTAIREKGIDTPIIGLTANVLREDKMEFLSHGINHFLSKPVSRSHLLSGVRQVFGIPDEA
eukprot:Nk52_evm21s564 gene=Nk52_evmTU21s564